MDSKHYKEPVNVKSNDVTASVLHTLNSRYEDDNSVDADTIESSEEKGSAN